MYGTAFCPISMLEKVKDLGVAGMFVVNGHIDNKHHSIDVWVKGRC